MTRCAIVYCLTCKAAGKRYVGQTIKTLEQRWKEHLRDALSGKGWKLGDALRKHGAGSFTIKTIERCTLARRFKREAHHVKRLNTFYCGLNSTPGGWGPIDSKIMSEAQYRVSAKKSASLKKTLSSAAAKKRCSVASNKMWSDKKNRKKCSTRMKRLWRSKCYRKKQHLALSAAAKKTWKSKSYRKKQCSRISAGVKKWHKQKEKSK